MESQSFNLHLKSQSRVNHSNKRIALTDNYPLALTSKLIVAVQCPFGVLKGMDRCVEKD